MCNRIIANRQRVLRHIAWLQRAITVALPTRGIARGSIVSTDEHSLWVEERGVPLSSQVAIVSKQFGMVVPTGTDGSIIELTVLFQLFPHPTVPR